MADAPHPQIIECELCLHSSTPGGEEPGGEEPGGGWPAADWARTAVGEPVTFRARADTATGLWNGPLSPGAAVASPVVLTDPWWTVRLPGSNGPPLFADRVGHALSIGDVFTLRPQPEGTWTAGVTFEGSIVVD